MQEQHIRIFGERDADEYLNDLLQRAQDHVRQEDQNYLLNVGEESYLEFLRSLADPGGVQIMFESQEVSEHQTQIPADHLPPGFDRHMGGMVKVNVVRFHIPFNGKPELLTLVPNPRIMWTQRVVVSGNELLLDIMDFYGNPTDIKQRLGEMTNNIFAQYKHLVDQLENFRANLDSRLLHALRSRKQQILQRRSVLAQLGVPVRIKVGEKPTYAVPVKSTPIAIRVQKPKVASTNFAPEPTLEETVYEEILRLITEMGQQLEKTPQVYEGKNEETLRDHLLLILSPHFEGGATGETFNKSGKTDILIRHEGKNVFIAECKFWGGRKAYLAAISQLLGYLTWRDSKAAVVLFVRNKDISHVLEEVEESTKSHSEFLRFNGKKGDSRFDYRFHLPDDKNREVHLAILLFHLP